jgi:VWFA-related protein
MKIASSVLGMTVMLATALLCAQSQQQPPQPQQTPPVFRAGVDLVELDVSVFDKDRRPVRGLTAKDFTVLEDSRPKPVDVFSAVDLPDPPPITAEWMKAPPVDVDTNDLTSGRLFVLVMDDQNLIGYRIPAIATAQRVIEALGPTDLAAVVFTGDNWSGQGFTADKARLMAAVEALGPSSSADVRGGGGGGRVAAPPRGMTSLGHPGGAPGPQPCAFLEILREIIDDLKTIQHRRKFVINISAAYTCRPELLMAGADGFLITRAQVADINVYSVSPTMLDPFRGGGSFLNYLSESTGGRAIINSNDPEAHVHEIFEENQSYYVLGFVSTNTKDRESLKRIEVKVDRPDVEVRTRTLYNAPKASEAGLEPKPSPKSSTISELVPKADIALKAGAAAFADVSGVNGTVLMVLSVHEPVKSDDIEVKGSAFTEDGRPQGNFQLVSAISGEKISGGNPPDILEARGEILGRIALKPGRYALRLSAKSRSTGKEGSVYTDVVVPEFSKEPVSLSGLVVSAAPGPRAAPRDIAISMIPVVPTAERAFDRTQQVGVFVRVYRAAGDANDAVTMRVRIVDDHDRVVIDKPSLLPAGAFTNRQSADFRLTLPIASWHPGPYLLSVSATRGNRVVTRELQITVR